MILKLYDELIPGTKLKRSDMDGLTGMEFLKKVFFISEGVMLTQIRDISGIDSSTLQNWTKRGWVANSRLKKYNTKQILNSHIYEYCFLFLVYHYSGPKTKHVLRYVQYLHSYQHNEPYP